MPSSFLLKEPTGRVGCPWEYHWKSEEILCTGGFLAILVDADSVVKDSVYLEASLDSGERVVVRGWVLDASSVVRGGVPFNATFEIGGQAVVCNGGLPEIRLDPTSVGRDGMPFEAALYS
jgi:hypothetical protein